MADWLEMSSRRVDHLTGEILEAAWRETDKGNTNKKEERKTLGNSNVI